MAFGVTHVIDGDTFEVSPFWKVNGGTDNRVRIADVNAPELGAPGGYAAKAALDRLIGGQSVVLYTKAIDVYGRLVAEVYLNGQDVSALL